MFDQQYLDGDPEPYRPASMPREHLLVRMGYNPGSSIQFTVQPPLESYLSDTIANSVSFFQRCRPPFMGSSVKSLATQLERDLASAYDVAESHFSPSVSERYTVVACFSASARKGRCIVDTATQVIDDRTGSIVWESALLNGGSTIKYQQSIKLFRIWNMPLSHLGGTYIGLSGDLYASHIKIICIGSSIKQDPAGFEICLYSKHFKNGCEEDALHFPQMDASFSRCLNYYAIGVLAELRKEKHMQLLHPWIMTNHVHDWDLANVMQEFEGMDSE